MDGPTLDLFESGMDEDDLVLIAQQLDHGFVSVAVWLVAGADDEDAIGGEFHGWIGRRVAGWRYDWSACFGPH